MASHDHSKMLAFRKGENMIIGTHTVVASKDPEADHAFLREHLGLSSVDAGGGYVIFGLPKSEMSVHETKGDVPHHELYFLTDDIDAFKNEMAEKNVRCSDVQNTGWGRLVSVTLPSGSPLQVYEPRHSRP